MQRRRPIRPIFLLLAGLVCAGGATACDEPTEPRGLADMHVDAPEVPPPGTPCDLPGGMPGKVSNANMSLLCWHEVKAEPDGPVKATCSGGEPNWTAYVKCELKCDVTVDALVVDDPEHENACLAGQGTGIPAYIGGCEEVLGPPPEPVEKQITLGAKLFKAADNYEDNMAACEAYLAAAPKPCAGVVDDDGCKQYAEEPVATEHIPADGVCCLPASE